MMIWGRLIGALLGLRVFGIFGALIGYWIGSVFDKGIRLHLYHIPRSRSLAVQQAFFKATFSVMGHLAKADGRISEHEIRVAEQIMARLALNEDLKREAMQLFTFGKSSEFNLDQVLSNLMHECRQYPDLLRFFLEIQLETALADGELSSEKKRILLLICDKLQFNPQEFEQLWARQWASRAFSEWFTGQFNQQANQSYGQSWERQRTYGQQQAHATRQTVSLQDAYAVLGVSSSATPAEIKKAYRRLMSQHHPDKLVSRGLPEGMINLAKEKTQQITAAYNIVREARGFR